MGTPSAFHRLVRFVDIEGQICYGELGTAEIVRNGSLEGLTVAVYEGKGPFDSDFLLGSTTKTIAKVLSPIESVPIFIGIGLNYRKHAEEAKFPIPPFPMIFNKPSAALAGPYEDIPINEEAKWLDYEGELCVVIGKDCKNLAGSDDPLEYVLGYTAGNDVSARWWQQPAQSGNQHGYAKSFDKFAPVGPVLCSKSQIPDPSKLTLTTRVNGEERQSTRTDDLIFDMPTIIRHASRGMTLQKGTVIMTGTPGGVAAFMKPPKWLANDDVVEIEISGIGTIKNRMKFES